MPTYIYQEFGKEVTTTKYKTERWTKQDAAFFGSVLDAFKPLRPPDFEYKTDQLRRRWLLPPRWQELARFSFRTYKDKATKAWSYELEIFAVNPVAGLVSDQLKVLQPNLEALFSQCTLHPAPARTSDGVGWQIRYKPNSTAVTIAAGMKTLIDLMVPFIDHAVNVFKNTPSQNLATTDTTDEAPQP